MGISRLKQVKRDGWLSTGHSRCVLECDPDPCSYSMKNACCHRTHGHRRGFPSRSSKASTLWLHFCLIHFYPRCHCGRQTSRDFLVLFFPPKWFVIAVLDHAASHHAQPQASLNHCLVRFPGDKLFWSNYGQENCFRKWLPVKNYTVRCGMAWIESEIRGFAVALHSHRAIIAHIWIIDGRQVIMMEQKLSGLAPKGWGLLCLSQSRQPWRA